MNSIFDENMAGDLKCRTCMLLITHACNLHCSYCYESHKDKKTMSFSLAKSIILQEAEHVKKEASFERLEIDFMGGEPLMNFPLIQEIVEWLEKEPLDVPFICFATTNGTLLDDSMKNWFRKHKNSIWLGASYDGSPKAQQKNRGEKAADVDYGFFYELWPRQGFKMTISKDSLPDLAEGILETQRKGYRLAASLAQGVDWTEDDAEIYLEQLRKLSRIYRSEDTLTPINLLTKELRITQNHEKKQKRFCGTGTYMATYDVDGKCYGCQMFSPLVLGDERAIESQQMNWGDEDIADDVRCRQCCLKDYCPTCMGYNYFYRGNAARRDFRWCKMILAEIIAACEFQILSLGQQKNLSGLEAEYGMAALKASSILQVLSIKEAEPPFKGGEEYGNP